jgi:hypothetical protein
LYRGLWEGAAREGSWDRRSTEMEVEEELWNETGGKSCSASRRTEKRGQSVSHEVNARYGRNWPKARGRPSRGSRLRKHLQSTVVPSDSGGVDGERTLLQIRSRQLIPLVKESVGSFPTISVP